LAPCARGLVVVNTNRCTPRELKHQLIDSGARAIVIVENFAHVCCRQYEASPVAIRHHYPDRRPAQFPKSLLVNPGPEIRQESRPALDPFREQFRFAVRSRRVNFHCSQ
jgi:hypothetical protein